MKFPKSVEITDDSLVIDGEPFPYYVADPATEGYELIEAADDHMVYLVLKVLLPMETGSSTTNLVDRRELAAMWLRGFEAAGDPEAQKHLVTGDHELGMAWSKGSTHHGMKGAQPWGNPYILLNENPDGTPKA